jgi:Primase X
MIVSPHTLEMRHMRHMCHGIEDICHKEVKEGLDFILRHFSFSALPFPRTISTKTTEGRQITVKNKDEALARFRQANYLDCRINAYSRNDIIGDPNFVFIDIDSTDYNLLIKILAEKLWSRWARPTILFTGSGYHIYQPIDTKSIHGDIDNRPIFHDLFTNELSYSNPSNQFLKFAERYLSNNEADSNHYPSTTSCMVRIPDTINSKNNLLVKILHRWDGNPLDIRLLLGSFYAHIRTVQMEQQKYRQNSLYNEISNNNKGRRKWIEDKLLKMGLDDYRKIIVNLVLAPYLVNVRQLSFEQASRVIGSWLKLCSIERELDFNPKHLVQAALTTAKKSGYKPMSLSTLKQKNDTLCRSIGLN